MSRPSTELSWLVLATHVPPGGGLGGVVRYTSELIAALAVRPDVRVSALTVRSSAATLAELVGDRARVLSVPDALGPLLPGLERAGALPGLTGRPPFDVVHGVKHLLPRSAHGATRVLTVHDLLLLERPQDFPVAKRTLLPPAFRGSLRDADLLLAVSTATGRRLAGLLPGSGGRTAVVPLATASTLLEAAPVPVPVLAGRRFALVVGDPGPRKNLGVVVDGWAEVRRQVPDAVLAVVGPPAWGRSELGERFARLVADGAVLALGHVPDAQLRWCYGQAAIVLCPSLAEGFGLPAAEALDLGAPLVVSDDPALVEVAGARARAVLPAKDRGAWARATVEALTDRAPRQGAPATVRRWGDVAEETVAAVRRVRGISRTS